MLAQYVSPRLLGSWQTILPTTIQLFVLLQMPLTPTVISGRQKSAGYGQLTWDMYLAAKHFVEGVNTTSLRKLFDKIKAAITNATTETAVDIDRLDDLDQLEKELNGLELDGDGDELDADKYEVADMIGKLLALITQVNLQICALYITLKFVH